MSAAGQHHLGRLAEQSFARRGDYPALLFEGRWHGSGELFERACAIAGGLSELGVAPGDRVVVTMANCPEVGVMYNAIWRAGAVVTPATFVLAADELAHVIADSEARAVVTTPDMLAKVSEAISQVAHRPALLCTEPEGSGVIPLSELERAGAAPIADRADDDLAALLYTGGTTGRAKGVMLSHANLHYTGGAAYEVSHVEGITRALVTLPLSHAYGLLVTLTGIFSTERPVSVLLKWFDPVSFLALVQEHGLQLSSVVPSMLQILLSHPLEEYDLSTLAYLTSGGAPLAPEVEREFTRRVPTVAIRQGYGMTETASLVATNPPLRTRTGSVGLPVPGTEVRIADEQGEPLAPGQSGEVWARSPGVMRGYWRAPEATAEALDEDGWLHTGDIGRLDEDGYLYIVDRKKDLVIRGGFNVYPRDIEDALVNHPAVHMAAVVGRPDVRLGEEVVAFVSLRPGARITADELIAWSREHIGGYKYPREVHLVETVPVTAVGKIDRKALRAALARP
jgi:long-chain acyl-CoA synthetase